MNVLNFIKTLVNQIETMRTGYGAVDIVMSANGQTIVFPIVPAELPEIENAQNNEVFQGVLADISVVGNLALRRVTWASLLPPSPAKYSFCRPNGSTASEIINFIKRNQVEFRPMRLAIVYMNGAAYLDMKVLVNNFKYHRDNVGDYHYEIDLVEYPEVGGRL